MHLTTPALPLLLALATPLAAQAADTRVQPITDPDPMVTEPGAVTTTVTRTDVAVVPIAVRDEVDDGRIRGRHRIHIESDAFSWRRWQSWAESDDATAVAPTTDSFNILGGAPMFGVPGSGPAGNVTFGYGYGVSENVVLGARLGIGWQQFTQPDLDDRANRTVAYNVVPYIQYVFRPGFNFRPYIGVRVGVGGASTANVVGDVTQRISTIGPLFGASLGFHAFLTKRVSFDAALAFDYALGYSRTRVNGGDMNQRTDFTRASQMPNLALVVGFSMWLGRDRADRNILGNERISARR